MTHAWNLRGYHLKWPWVGTVFLNLYFLSAHPVICISEHLQRQNFFKLQIRKPNSFCLVTKKREEFAFGCELLKEKGKDISQLWCSSCWLSSQNFEKPVGTLEKTSPSPRTLLGRQKTANIVHDKEHLLFPQPPSPPPPFFWVCN